MRLDAPPECPTLQTEPAADVAVENVETDYVDAPGDQPARGSRSAVKNR
jgi:hypothetical protein